MAFKVSTIPPSPERRMMRCGVPSFACSRKTLLVISATVVADLVKWRV
jgi:hypothetical protein